MIVRRIASGRPNWLSWGDVDLLRKDMLRLLDQVDNVARDQATAGVFPAVNVTQDRNNYYIRAELPGVKAQDLEISAVSRTLTLTGKRNDQGISGVSHHRKERPDGEFNRSIDLPGNFDNDKVEAKLVHGLLTVVLPKPEQMKARQITVKTV